MVKHLAPLLVECDPNKTNRFALLLSIFTQDALSTSEISYPAAESEEDLGTNNGRVLP